MYDVCVKILDNDETVSRSSCVWWSAERCWVVHEKSRGRIEMKGGKNILYDRLLISNSGLDLFSQLARMQLQLSLGKKGREHLLTMFFTATERVAFAGYS